MEEAIYFYESLIPSRNILLPNELVGNWQSLLEKYLNIIPYFNFDFSGNYILSAENLQNSTVFIIISFLIVWTLRNSNTFVEIKNNELVFPQLERIKINSFGVYLVYLMFFFLFNITN